MKVGISCFETPWLSIDDGELLTQKECPLLFGQRLGDGGCDLGTDFDDVELLYRNIGDVLKTQRRRIDG